MSLTQSPSLSYAERAELCSNSVARSVFQLMDRKQTNLCVSVDVETQQELLRVTREIAREICLLKFHVEIIQDFDRDLIHQLVQLAEEEDFLIVSDSKIGDIGNTAKNLYTKGLYRMVEWADLVTAHPVPGPGIIEALFQAAGSYSRGLLLVAQMSSADTLTDDNYIQRTVQMALNFPEAIAGFVCQKRVIEDPRFIHFTPGVNLSDSQDALGQQFRHPYTLCREFSDIIAVGRGVYRAENPAAAARRYRSEAWRGYTERG